MWTLTQCRRSILGRKWDPKRELVFHGLIFVSILYVIVITIQNGHRTTTNFPFGRATGGRNDPCLLSEERCREEHLRIHLTGLTEWDLRTKHPRYKYEDLIASIKCSEWYVLNMTECHGGEVLQHEDFYCTQKLVSEMKGDHKAYNLLRDHCHKYHFPIRGEEIEDLEHLSLF